MFKKGKDLLDYCKEHNTNISEATLRYEETINDNSRDNIYQNFAEMYEVMKESTSKGLNESVRTMSGMFDGNAKKMKNYMESNNTLSDSFTIEAMARALSVLEVNGSMGKIVATPTAGAAGVLPAALVTMQNRYDFTDEEIITSMVTAAAIGGIIASNATISGAEGGCQAETGSASAMTAAALVELMGGSVEACFNGASFALIHVLGLVCDPIGGLVEFPCGLRNASGVSNAIISADLALAGVESIIPFDEVVDAMFHIGNALPDTLRETALGGLAAAPSACNFCDLC